MGHYFLDIQYIYSLFCYKYYPLFQAMRSEQLPGYLISVRLNSPSRLTGRLLRLQVILSSPSVHPLLLTCWSALNVKATLVLLLDFLHGNLLDFQWLLQTVFNVLMIFLIKFVHLCIHCYSPHLFYSSLYKQLDLGIFHHTLLCKGGF